MLRTLTLQDFLEFHGCRVDLGESVQTRRKREEVAWVQTVGFRHCREVLVYVGDLNNMEMATWDRQP